MFDSVELVVSTLESQEEEHVIKSERKIVWLYLFFHSLL